MQKIVAIIVTLSQLFTSFTLSLCNRQINPIDYGGTKYNPPVITQWLTIVDEGESDYVIVKGAECSPSEVTAATELQSYIEQISGKRLEITNDTARVREHEILVGKTNRENKSSYTIDRAALGDEGFTVMTYGEKLVIAGGELRGTLYGVYTFLENELGCRWYAPEAASIPNLSTIKINADLNYSQTPVFEYRHTDWHVTADQDWRVKQKLNEGVYNPIYGRTVFYANGCHSMTELLPETYFDEHPEYFSYREDKDARTTEQRCLTNPDVLRIVTENVRQALLASPAAKMVSITQCDNQGYCQCPDCKASDALYGGPSGTNIRFVNKVAEALERDFPGVCFDTFAYQYTRTPPKNIVPRDSVVVRLCSIECCFAHPLEECGHLRIRSENRTDKFPYFETDTPRNRVKQVDSSFAEDVKGWAEICQKLYIWDYTNNYLDYMALFPNFQVFSPNMQFFAENNVQGVFEEGKAASKSGEFGEAKAYILSKLLWDPQADVEYLLDDFLQGYYGKESAPFIKEYINIVTNKAINTRHHLYTFQWSYEGMYFNALERRRMNALWDSAESKAENEEQLLRLRRSRLSFRYYKANLLMDEFSALNPLRHYRENEKLYNDTVESGINDITIGHHISQSPNFWLTPNEW